MPFTYRLVVFRNYDDNKIGIQLDEHLEDDDADDADKPSELLDEYIITSEKKLTEKIIAFNFIREKNE